MPFVVVNRRVEVINGLEADYVMVDAERGCYLATRHLLEQGQFLIQVFAQAEDEDTGAASAQEVETGVDVANLARRFRFGSEWSRKTN